MCSRVDLKGDVDGRHGKFSGAFTEDQVGISSKSGDDMASRQCCDVVTNFEARTMVAAGVGDEALVVGVQEGGVSDVVGGHEVEEGFWMHWKGGRLDGAARRRASCQCPFFNRQRPKAASRPGDVTRMHTQTL